MKKIFILLLMLLISNITVNAAGTFKADAKTKRIASGTRFELEFLQPITTSSGAEGDFFTASLKNELSTDNVVILPKGSVVRGSISTIKTAKRFSRGAMLYLDFDHVVTPNGRQIPLDMSVTSFDKIYYDGGLYKNLGYGEAVKTPFCAVGGFFGGAGYLVGTSIADMFKKGQDVIINSGDTISVQLINPIDIPVY